jgi:hypothetical protein
LWHHAVQTYLQLCVRYPELTEGKVGFFFRLKKKKALSAANGRAKFLSSKRCPAGSHNDWSSYVEKPHVSTNAITGPSVNVCRRSKTVRVRGAELCRVILLRDADCMQRFGHGA